MHTLDKDWKRIWLIAFAPDSKSLASACSDKTVHIWCTQTGALLQTLKRHEEKLPNGPVRVVFSPDQKHVAASGASAAVVWDLETGKEMCNFLEQEERIFLAVAFSPNSKLLASAHR
ncbi:WD40-repeat-containing domain protein [Trichoderma austrokoningii]